jgi:beta-xylosidase
MEKLMKCSYNNDSQLFVDDDDKVYLCTSRSNHEKRQAPDSYLLTYGCEIDIQTGNSLTPPVLLRFNTVKDQGGGVAEGPHIYKRNNWYYLLTAEGGTGSYHKCWIQRSQNPLGPYEQPPQGINPLVYNPEGACEIGGTGHADFVEDENGNWWAVMLATHLHPSTGPVMGTVGRQTFLCPLAWSDDGWPILNKGELISRRVQTYTLPEAATDTVSDFCDEFSDTRESRNQSDST